MRVRGRRRVVSLTADVQMPMRRGLVAMPMRVAVDLSGRDAPEANPAEHKLSNESPIGKALLGAKKNEVVTVETPRGPKKKLKVTKIEAA